jgi:hypothetical protein
MSLPKVDAVVTLIVLQHNPPPVIKLILRSLLDALKQGGVAYFQLLTYSERLLIQRQELSARGGITCWSDRDARVAAVEGVRTHRARQLQRTGGSG